MICFSLYNLYLTKSVDISCDYMFVLTLVPGVTLGFMPATGWVNSELILTRCYYVALFPGALILLNSILSIIPIIVVAVLYSIILVQALKTVKTINSGVKNFKAQKSTKETSENEENPKMRIYRGSKSNSEISTQSVKIPNSTLSPKLKRSASFNVNYKHEDVNILQQAATPKSKSTHDLIDENVNTSKSLDRHIDTAGETTNGSIFSVCTIHSTLSQRDVSNGEIKTCKLSNHVRKICNVNKFTRKPKEPNKWRAITIVLLTSGGFIFTWLPFFITVIFFVFCEDKMTNPQCLYIRHLLGGPLATLAFINSVLNPIIYAWWHKGFQKSVRNYYKRYLRQYVCRTS